MPLTLELLTPPSSEPVTIEEVTRHLRVDEVVSDYELLEAYITMARTSIEEYLRWQLLTATWKLSLDRFPNLIRVPRPPLQSVTTIEYIDTQDTLQTLDAAEYQVDSASQPGRIMVARGKTWPTVAHATFNAVQITYQAGHTAIANIPPPIRLCLMMLAGDFYEHREAALDIGGGLQRIDKNMTYVHMLAMYRIIEP